ncbi:hypothetical protein HPCPY1962_1422 [Helicobacter pylori CPY1962]|nr:hypothetical protein HPCPY1962_1422 [Helicobacter pylori CPY1962]
MGVRGFIKGVKGILSQNTPYPLQGNGFCYRIKYKTTTF